MSKDAAGINHILGKYIAATFISSHDFGVFQPDVGQDGFLTRMRQRAFCVTWSA